MLPELSDKDRTWYILKGYSIREYGDRLNPYRLWYLNGKLHRTDGPAYERSDGHRVWYLNGVCHREDGPAIEYADGTKEWYLNGIEMSEEEHRIALNEKMKNATA